VIAVLGTLLTLFCSIGFLLSSTNSLAESGGEAAPSTPMSSSETATSAPVADSAPKAPKSRKTKGKRPREKEIEGTEARDRFQADTVLKSKYQLNGEQLEVDPD
jgi:hypothetical protein